MNSQGLHAMVAAAEGYEAFLVPALFRQWTGAVLDAAEVDSNKSVLDVACGTGVLARAAHERVGASGKVVGVDPGAGMLAVAERLAPAVEWRQGTAEALPFPDATFDAVVSQFGLMFFSDRDKAIAEMLRVLKPGAKLAVAVWDALENIPAYAEEVAVIERMAGAAAADALRAPFVLGDNQALVRLIQAAAAVAPQLETHHGTGRFASIRALVEGDLRGWLPLMGVRLCEETIQQTLAEAERALAAFVSAAGAVEFQISAHIVTAGKTA